MHIWKPLLRRLTLGMICHLKQLPSCMLRKLSEEDMNTYRKPYLEPGESRRPTLTWRREVPVAGEPSDVHKIIRVYGKWLASSDIPKLFIEAIPGVMFESHRDFAKTWLNQTHVKIAGGHFLEEDSPDEIGAAIIAWLQNLRK